MIESEYDEYTINFQYSKGSFEIDRKHGKAKRKEKFEYCKLPIIVDVAKENVIRTQMVKYVEWVEEYFKFVNENIYSIECRAYYYKKNIKSVATLCEEYVNYYIIVMLSDTNSIAIDFQCDVYEKYRKSKIVAEVKRQLDNNNKIRNVKEKYCIEKHNIRNLFVFSGESAGFIIHEIVGHLSEDENPLDFWKTGNVVFPDGITVVDNPKIKNFVGSFEFDDEGMPTDKKEIIKNGRINEFLVLASDRKSLGNARCENYYNMPRARMSNTYLINLNKDKCEGVLEKEYIYVYEISRGGVNYSFGEVYLVCKALYFRDGEWYQIPQIFIHENVMNFFEKIVRIGNNIKFANSAWCIKNNDIAIPVKYGSPDIIAETLGFSFIKK